MKNYVWGLLIVCFFISCNKSGEDDKTYTYIIDLDNVDDMKSIRFSDLYGKSQITVLETNENILLHGIDKLIASKDRLYIFDRKACVIAEFDQNGKFIRKYGNRGAGPGEYLDARDFTIDENRRGLWILDQRLQKLFCYDMDTGTFLKDLRISENRDETSYSLAVVGDLICLDLHYFSSDSPQYMMKSLNIDNPEIETYYLDRNVYLKGWDYSSRIGINKFIYNNQYLTAFTNTFINQVFKIGINGIEDYIFLKSKNCLTNEDRQGISQKSKTAGIMSDPLSDSKKYHDISNYYETSQFICFDIAIDMSLRHIIYNKNTGETIMETFIENDLLCKEQIMPLAGITRFCYADEYGAFYQIMPRDINNFRLAAQEGLILSDPYKLEEIKNLPEDSNPVIIYYEFRRMPSGG